ncbi:Transcriptional regulatory protein DEP1 [Cyphellophora attinorum]|uniref:Transcriptional regulatory protein DEP1 n=1 Tax=Cyphellophora attinorum TaxID=1664694 RepID=A0A0N1P3E2_9EURO|nr:Transcriptional regulatory protein DEP1 [Phialophora attinorum]KPI45365.1 Transcriptional regulatory protein DEP1 [Phialophora attinorum]
MDSAADSLLALSTTATALAEAEQQLQDDDDRSSSLSELEGDLDDEELSDVGDDAGDEAEIDIDGDDDELEEGDEEIQSNDTPNRHAAADGDSEAETERLEESPDKLNRRKSFIATPSKLAQPLQMNHSPNERPEIESLTDSAVSSPISTNSESDDDLSDVPAENEDEEAPEKTSPGDVSPNKRKRDDEEQLEDIQDRNRKRRTLSDISPNAKLLRETIPEVPQSRESKANSEEPTAEAADAEDAQSDEEEAGVEDTDTGVAKPKTKKPTPPSRVSARRKGKGDPQQDVEADAEEDGEGGDDSEEEEVDDAEVAAKSEEEQAKRMSAMEQLGVLEKHFANLRDRLYDEKIAAINHELAQLAEPTPTHPELIKQVAVVKAYRDEKIEIAQKTLVYKIGALKTKSVAERAQAHSAYFQETRDIRERHLEIVNERFVRIQRERFKSDTTTPTYAVPFPTKRSKQVIQQTAYNKEVSLLSGVAKYVGFPAAPDLMQTSQKDLEDDLQKMGIANQGAIPRPVQRMTSTYSNISQQAAADEQSFLDKNPWASNPPTAAYRMGMNRQTSNQSPMNEMTYLTPAHHQQRQPDNRPAIMGSASTIAEHASSSQINTPHDGSVIKPEQQQTNGYPFVDRRNESRSPLDTRRPLPNGADNGGRVEIGYNNALSSPVPGRMALGGGSNSQQQRTFMTLADSMPSRATASPTMPTKTAGITTGPGLGMSRF